MYTYMACVCAEQLKDCTHPIKTFSPQSLLIIMSNSHCLFISITITKLTDFFPFLFLAADVGRRQSTSQEYLYYGNI